METEKSYTITESQLKKLIDKVEKNIKSKTDKKGEYSLGSSISSSATDTIQNFFTKNCINLEN